MPEETTTAPTASAPSASPRRALGFGCAALIAVPLLAVLVLIAALAWQARGGTDYPRAAPEEMANRAFRHSQEAYDVLGFRRTVQPGAEQRGVSPENTFGTALCWDSGPLGLDDKTVDGAYRMSHEWALDHIPADQAAAGLRRLHQHLKDTGWKISSYREGGTAKDWSLYAEREDGDERMSFTWSPDSQYFTGGATAPCAYDPAWRSGDTRPSGEGRIPPALVPNGA